VRDEQEKRSDVDILVEFGEISELFQFIALERHLQRLLRKKVDLERKKAIRAELKSRILKEAVYIWRDNNVAKNAGKNILKPEHFKRPTTERSVSTFG